MSYARIKIEPLTRSIGAQIHGVDLRAPLDEETRAELRRAMLEYHVVFFRDQELTPEEHVSVTAIFGEVRVEHSFFPHPEGRPEIEIVAKQENSPGGMNFWHSDMTWRSMPPIGGLLYSRLPAPVGGDTIWRSQTAAFEALPAKTQQYLSGMVAIHRADSAEYTDFLLDQENGVERLRAVQDEFPQVEHPVICTHPYTGKKLIFTNPTFASRIKGVDRDESRRILQFLADHTMRPEFQVRWRWTKFSGAIWDNWSTQHYPVSDYQGYARTMHKVLLVAPERPSYRA